MDQGEMQVSKKQHFFSFNLICSAGFGEAIRKVGGLHLLTKQKVLFAVCADGDGSGPVSHEVRSVCVGRGSGSEVGKTNLN